jgi:hypothetical protein
VNYSTNHSHDKEDKFWNFSKMLIHSPFPLIVGANVPCASPERRPGEFETRCRHCGLR